MAIIQPALPNSYIWFIIIIKDENNLLFDSIIGIILILANN